MTVWDVKTSADTIGNGAPGSWGGHCIPIIGYDSEWLTVITWGAPMKMSWRFAVAFVDELYAVLSPDFIASGEAPNQIALQQLQADLAAI
jgi:hypothetical protein